MTGLSTRKTPALCLQSALTKGAFLSAGTENLLFAAELEDADE